MDIHPGGGGGVHLLTPQAAYKFKAEACWMV